METFKIIVEGKVFYIHAIEVIGWNPKYIEDDDEDDSGEEDPLTHTDHINSDDDQVQVENIIDERSVGLGNNKKVNDSKVVYEDPFQIYNLLAWEKKVEDLRFTPPVRSEVVQVGDNNNVFLVADLHGDEVPDVPFAPKNDYLHDVQDVRSSSAAMQGKSHECLQQDNGFGQSKSTEVEVAPRLMGLFQ